MTHSSSEIKSGFLIVVSIVFLVALTFVVGNFLGGDTHAWQIRFGYVSGLEVNAPVYFAGLEVGKVEKVDILRGEERPILLTVRVSDNVHLRENTKAYIDTLGLLGEKFVELTPGTPATGFLRAGTVLEGVDPIATHILIRKMNLLADRMDELTVSLNPLIGRVDGLLKDSEEDLAKTIANLHETSQNVRDMTHDLKFRPWRLVRKG